MKLVSLMTHRSVHSFTMAKLPSPMTFPILYFSKTVDADIVLLPLTAGDKNKITIRALNFSFNKTHYQLSCDVICYCIQV